MKKKNQPRKHLYILFSILIMLGVFVVALLLSIRITSHLNMQATIDTYRVTLTDYSLELTQIPITVQFQQTSVAKIRENPDYKFTLTPFYGEIAMNAAIHQVTQTPDHPSECEIVADYFIQRHAADAIIADLFKHSIDAQSEISTGGVWGIEEICSEFTPVYTRIRIWADIDTADKTVDMNTRTILKAIRDNFDTFEYLTSISSRIMITIIYEKDDKFLSTHWELVESVLETSDDLWGIIGFIQPID